MDSLGEFDYYRWSGWMFSYNGRYPGYSMSACKPQDGAVIRLRYTLALGKTSAAFLRHWAAATDRPAETTIRNGKGETYEQQCQ